MKNLIENTLNILTKLSLSKLGYLLQITEQDHSIIKSWGGVKNEDFDLLNDILFNQFKGGKVDTENLQSLTAVTNLFKEKIIKSFFIRELVDISEQHKKIYILLFSEKKNVFTNECTDRIVSVLSILSSQVKEWITNSSDDIKLNIHIDQIIESPEERFKGWKHAISLFTNTSPDLMFIIDKEGKIVLVNESGREILEYSERELFEKHFTDLISYEDIDKVSEALNKTLQKKRPTSFTARVITKSEQEIPFEINCITAVDNEIVIGMLGTGRDLSEKQKLEHELETLKSKLRETNRLLTIEKGRINPQGLLLEELNRVKFEFVANLSHEFRTTLASIVGFSETIESDVHLPEEMKIEFNRLIMSEGKRLAKLINEILDISKYDFASVALNITTIGIVHLIQEVIDANQDFAQGKNITITFEHPQEEMFIEADNENIRQVIKALVNNAIKFTGEYGRVKVIVNNLFREVEVIVSDTGTGIPERDLPYIFQRFYKISRPLSDIPSTGVGLVFVKQIIDLHKGLITVQSDEGSGTTFMVKLPKTGKIENQRGIS